MTILQRFLENPSNYQTLDLSNEDITPQDVQKISKVLENNTTLIELNLSSCKIGDDGAAALSEALKVNETLIELNLSSCKIGNDGAAAISEALKVNETLMFLYLDSNNIGTAGAVALSISLANNETLTGLTLDSNSIGTAGAVALSISLANNENLMGLGLNSNSIGDDGAVAMSEALKINKDLIMLALSSNDIGADGAVAISEALKVNETLVGFGLSLGEMEENVIVTISEALEGNKSLIHFDSDCYIRVGDLTESLITNKVLIKMFLGEKNKEDVLPSVPVCAYQNEEERSVVSEDEIRIVPNILRSIKFIETKMTPDFLASSVHVDMYNILGDQFKAEGLYKQAIMCYRVINKSLSIKQCFKDWMESDPKNPEILMMRGDHLKSTGQYDKAIAQYRYAMELGGEDTRAKVINKIANVLDNKDNLIDHYIQMLSTNSLNCEMLTEEFLSELSGDASGYEFV